MKPLRKGRLIPQKSAERLKCLLPVASSQFLSHCRNFLVLETKNEEYLCQNYLSLRENENIQQWIEATSQKHTFAFKYPGNGLIYISL